MRARPRVVDVLLFTTVLLWSLSVVASRYAISHAFPPVAFSAIRQLGSASILAVVCTRLDGGLAVPRSALRLICVAAVLGFLNQLFFVYAVRLSTAATVGILLGTVPILTALIAASLGLERVSRQLGLAAAISFAGVALVSARAGDVDASAMGIGLGFLTALSWAGYSVAIARLTMSISALRVSAVVMLSFTPLLLGAASVQLVGLDFAAVDWTVWACVVGVALGTVVSTVFWFTGLERVGPSYATLFANLQPFFVVLFGVLLLSEPLSPWVVAGGVAIAAGLTVAWRARIRIPVAAE